MYSEGQGVPQNYAEAAKWYRLAADRGDAQAQYNLGLFYAYALTLSGSPASPLAVLDRGFEASEPNRKWIADFTYVWTAEGWLYVAAVIDLFSRRVVGWSMSAGMTAQLVTDALVMAIWRRGKPDALLHHSDRGSQYPLLHKNILCARKERNAKRRRDTAGTQPGHSTKMKCEIACM